MFKRVNQQELLRRNAKDVGGGSLNKLRILQSLPLKKLNDSESSHSSVMTNSIHSSIRNIHNASLTNSSIISSEFSIRNSLLRSRSKQKVTPQLNEKQLSRQQIMQQLLQRNFQRPFTKSLVQFLNKNWSSLQKQYLQQKKLQNFVSCVVQRGSWLKDLIDQFLQKEYNILSGQDRKGMTSILFRESSKAFKDLQTIIPEIIKKIPDERLLGQETTLEEISKKLLDIYNPSFSYSNQKMKERLALYLDQFISKRNNLKSQICEKLKFNLHFVEEVQGFFALYQKQILKLKTQLSGLQLQKNKYQQMLTQKSNFTAIQVDYDKLYDMKQKAQLQIKQDLQINIIKFHEEKHKKDEKKIAMLQELQIKLKLENEKLVQRVQKLKQEISDWNKNRPLMLHQGTQVFLISQGKGGESYANAANGLTIQFLQNVITPFSFTKDITASLINILTVDKILYDYDTIRQKLSLVSFEEFILEWFIIRTGSKKVAQIFIKNFQYSLKQLRTTHKRFMLFQKLCGWSGFKHRNMQQDLQGIFFKSHICWYYLMRLILIYRRKLNENPTGYHIMPPLPCEQIFKVPLRKIYELVEEFLKGQNMEVPPDITQKIDQYCINEISKFKSHDEEFQKETLEEIHILREINFDLIAGFVLQYVCSIKCGTVQKLLRTIQNKQRQDGTVVTYTEFENIYRRFYKERRAKIEVIFSKLCLANQHDMLDVQNMHHVINAILEDQSLLRSSFQKLEPFKVLILSEKAMLMKGEKRISNPNSYQNFRERYYHQFYDFYSTTSFLQEIFRIVKSLIKKKLQKVLKSEQQIAFLTDPKRPLSSQQSIRKASISKKNQYSQDSQSESISESRSSMYRQQKWVEQSKDFFVNKLQEWGKIIVRVPHFTSNVLTIDQIIVHNMKRKEMIEATEYAWKTLREILSVLGKE